MILKGLIKKEVTNLGKYYYSGVYFKDSQQTYEAGLVGYIIVEEESGCTRFLRFHNTPVASLLDRKDNLNLMLNFFQLILKGLRIKSALDLEILIDSVSGNLWLSPIKYFDSSTFESAKRNILSGFNYLACYVRNDYEQIQVT